MPFSLSTINYNNLAFESFANNVPITVRWFGRSEKQTISVVRTKRRCTTRRPYQELRKKKGDKKIVSYSSVPLILFLNFQTNSLSQRTPFESAIWENPLSHWHSPEVLMALPVDMHSPTRSTPWIFFEEFGMQVPFIRTISVSLGPVTWGRKLTSWSVNSSQTL